MIGTRFMKSNLQALSLFLLGVCLLSGCQKKSTVIDSDAATKTCCAQLQIVDRAKQLWAEANQKSAADVPTWDDLHRYMRGHDLACPSGGTYTIGPISTPPSCSIPEHAKAFQALAR